MIKDKAVRDEIRLLRDCQGDLSLNAFARRIGISHTMLSMIFSGKRRPGRRVFRGLAEQFPKKREEIIRVFLALNGDKRYLSDTIATEST